MQYVRRRNGAVGLNFNPQAVVVGAILHPHIFHAKVYIHDWRKNSIERDRADRKFFRLLQLDRRVTQTFLDSEFYIQLGTSGCEGCDMQIGICHHHVSGPLDIPRRHLSFAFNSQSKYLRLGSEKF